jgi:hypothetical protein
MATKNCINSNLPIETSKGGTAAASFSNTYGVIVADTAGTALTSIDPGSSGEVFSSNGSSSAPEFKTATALGSMFQVVSSDPASPEIAQVWYNSTSQLYKGAQAVAGAWTATGSLNTARRWLGGNGTVSDALSFGGNTSNSDPGSPSTVTEQFDGSSWVSKNNLNTARYALTGAGTTSDGLSFGGLAGATSAVTESWNGTSWSAENNLNTARYALAGCGTGSDALSFGGVAGVASAVTESWNGTSWSAENNLNTARNSLAGCGTSSDALSIGGSSNVVERYNGTNWTAKSALNTSRQQLAASGSASDALCYGGYTGAASAVTERYNGIADAWTTVTALNTAVTQLHGASFQSNSSAALSFGGMIGSTVQSGSELYAGDPDVVIFDVS